ncbi:SWPV1-045 [Shearwaterpox virus]|uniref:SWPV1-045 n=1 Tax=Shearwaterpox virus TaxID=1974596 RepID=A0A1V0S7Q9_CNPV|nr:SWPV1-045 [Shearwaterpox virus]
MTLSTFSLKKDSDLYVECEVLASLYRSVLNEEKIVNIFLSDTIRENIKPFISENDLLVKAMLISDTKEYSFKVKNNSDLIVICICSDDFDLLVNNDDINCHLLIKDNIAKISSCNGTININFDDISKDKEHTIFVFFIEKD